jgi:hypothetical protein
MTQNSIVTVMEGILLEAVGCSGILQLHQERVKLVIVRRLALLPCVALIAHHRLG